MTSPTNPCTKPNPNPKKDPVRKATAKSKKAQRKAPPTKGTPLKIDDTELPKLADGSVDYETLQARLSKSDGTAANRKAGLRLFNNWALVNNMTKFEDLTPGEVVGENLPEMMRNVTSFFANVPTPAHYLDGLAPPNVDK